jgi:hypothetical protein
MNLPYDLFFAAPVSWIAKQNQQTDVPLSIEEVLT